ncbi:hypothetical protein [Lacticaseibacillus manihotivorans]|uniref:Uncharacterized protein n=1 Tax=Lacticaseibacillus manihotivorans DSM 13343 = JCM 12514 TaxID=1423769 RepID=A0A0R1QQG5_9LACO|nr:hypothetical protein [Lacticaseibacillus manihotivorans]KRL44290.1 hypothetical protein FD01_GL001191 [Lacticaseibacillus manihotivorans DSM 13343 = JCM 12514]
MIAAITVVAAIIQAHHANAAAAGANRVAKQELESVTKRAPELHFAIIAELKSGDDGKNLVDGYELFIMNYGDAPSVLSRRLGAQTIGADHPIFSQVWNGHGQFVEAMCNSILVMPGEVKPIFTGERTLGSDIKQKSDKGYNYYFPLFED